MIRKQTDSSKMKEVFLKVLIASSFFFQTLSHMQTLLTLHSNLSKTVNKIWAATSSIFHNKTSTNQNFIFIIDKESCYRSRHVLLDAVYILIYWWNMCHCHLKNQHQFIINLLWKTFESWKINCKKKRKRQCCAM